MNKTHWLKSPNKNYLGHWDLPDSGMSLTISQASLEPVLNPVTGEKKSFRVIRFKEPGIKPFICNQTNAKTIFRKSGKRYMEDCIGFILKLGIGRTRIWEDRNEEMVDCVRVLDVISPDVKLMGAEQINFIRKEIKSQNVKSEKDILNAYGVGGLHELEASKYSAIISRLKELAIDSSNDSVPQGNS